MTLATRTQLHLDSRSAVGFAAVVMDGCDLLFKLLVLLAALAGLALAPIPIVITAERDLKALAQKPNGMLGFHRADPLVALLGGSERMPKVFFKISRCCRR